ncbi:PadR family transcriptional regulator [Actinoallomurus sp. NPDC050550]|uniref:PadR family transcriptional regulator n=1 Tax=Actinoallomurus sp. NPDC050550 TaxID=3154937 RepID=UPI0033EBB655
MKRTVNNLLGLAVLSYLTERPMHAYELNRLLKDRDAARTFKLSYGALYGVVRQLTAAGMIQAAGTGQTGNLPRHTVYELTDDGRTEMREWLKELISEPRYEYPAFAAALSLAVVLSPAEVLEMLRARSRRVRADIAAVRDQRDATLAEGHHPVFLIEDDYRISLLEAECSFIEELMHKIEDPEDGWAGPWEAYHAGSQPGAAEGTPRDTDGRHQ